MPRALRLVRFVAEFQRDDRPLYPLHDRAGSTPVQPAGDGRQPRTNCESQHQGRGEVRYISGGQYEGLGEGEGEWLCAIKDVWGSRALPSTPLLALRCTGNEICFPEFSALILMLGK